MEAYGYGLAVILIFSALIGVMLGAACWFCNKLIDKFWSRDALIDEFFSESDENGNKIPLTDFILP